MAEQLQNKGVNMQRQAQFQEAYEQAIRQQMQARAQQQQQAAGGGEAVSAELESMLGN